MITSLLNRPDNVLTNRLGYVTPWKTILYSSQTTTNYFILNKIFLTKYFKVLFRVGVIHTHHIFFNKFFFFKKHFFLPRIETNEAINKFFRFTRLRTSYRFKAKRNLYVRKILTTLNITELFFFKIVNFILITVYVYIPEPVKRFFFLKNLTLRKKISTTLTHHFSKKSIILKKLYYKLI